MDVLNGNLTPIVIELAVAMGAPKFRKETGKLSRKMKELIVKCRSLKMSRIEDEIGFIKQLKLINKGKVTTYSCLQHGKG